MPSDAYDENDETIVAPAPCRAALAGRARLHFYDFKLSDGGGGITYEKDDPSRITIRLGNAEHYFRLTVDEGIALRLREDLGDALQQYYANRRRQEPPPR
jgi:hypothetical protein